MIFKTVSVCYVRITVAAYSGFTSEVSEFVPATVYKLLDLQPLFFVSAIENDFV